MPAKLVTYNSQNYAGTLGSGLNCSIIAAAMGIILSIMGNFSDHSSKA